MGRFQFNTRQLLAALTLFCVALAFLTWLARHCPEVFIFAFVGSCSIGLFGVGIVVLAALIALSVWASEERSDRKAGLAKCLNLATIGALMVALPVVLLSLTFFLL